MTKLCETDSDGREEERRGKPDERPARRLTRRHIDAEISAVLSILHTRKVTVEHVALTAYRIRSLIHVRDEIGGR